MSNLNINKTVTTFLDELNHPLRKEIELLRICILSADSNLIESIKWNGPNYSIDGEDRITMRIQPPTSKQVQVIFHRGAKKQTQPESQLIEDPSKLLVWKENDRAIASFKSIGEIEKSKEDLIAIVKLWVMAAK